MKILSPSKNYRPTPSSLGHLLLRSHFRILSTALALALVFTSAGCVHRNREMYNPRPITVAEATISSRKTSVRALITEALRDYEWIIQKEAPGVIIARQSRGGHAATIKISYDNVQVRIAYVDSENLLFRTDSEGTDRIHTRYNTWITNLERRIAALVQY
jgi:hypothetical protein